MSRALMGDCQSLLKHVLELTDGFVESIFVRLMPLEEPIVLGRHNAVAQMESLGGLRPA